MEQWKHWNFGFPQIFCVGFVVNRNVSAILMVMEWNFVSCLGTYCLVLCSQELTSIVCCNVSHLCFQVEMIESLVSCFLSSFSLLAFFFLDWLPFYFIFVDSFLRPFIFFLFIAIFWLTLFSRLPLLLIDDWCSWRNDSGRELS